MLTRKRAGLMAKAIEQGTAGDLPTFFERCLRAHAQDVWHDIEDNLMGDCWPKKGK